MKKKILILVNKFVVGGIETTLLTLLKNLDYKKYDVTLGIFVRGGELEAEIPKEVSIKYLLKHDISQSKRKSFWFWTFMQFAPKKLINALFIKDKYDVAIAYTLDFIYFIKGFRGKKVCWVHGDWFPFKMRNNLYGKLRKKITNKYFESCEKIVCCSEHLKRELISFSGNKLSNVIFLKNPINKDYILSKASEECDYHFKKDKIYLVTVGRLVKQKGYDRLIPIIGELSKKYESFKLIIIGDGPDLGFLKELVSKHKCEEFVEFIGYKSNPFCYINKCDVFVCSSYMEGYSTSISESIILGKAIVSTNCGGSDQLLNYGEAGILVDNDSESLKKGIEIILKDRSLIEKYKNKSLSRRETLFDTKKIIQDIERIAF